VPLIQAGLNHPGFALIDVLSPCVTFNDHEGSTKSYAFTREHYHAVVEADFVPPAKEISVDYAEGDATVVPLHDGSRVRLRKLDPDYDPSDRTRAYAYIDARLKQGEYLTGLIHVGDGAGSEMHAVNHTSTTPLNALPFAELSPGAAALAKLMDRYR
jgi:2-oxoglutarate ferredoxin oxidoreductase subunit beta